MTENEIAWDLSFLFSNPEDPNFKKKMEILSKRAENFVEFYKGKIDGTHFKPKDVLALIKEEEAFWSDFEELNIYAVHTFNANMTLPQNKALLNTFRDFETKLNKKLAFIDLELGKYLFKNKHVINDALLSNYKHYMEKFVRIQPHQLSEVEEQLILEKDQYGVVSWSQLQGTWLNTRKFEVKVEGKKKILSYGEANSLLTHPDRETRISANKSIYRLLGEDEEIFSTALSNICGDWLNISKRRKFENPMQHSLIVNDTNQETIDNLMKIIKENVEVYRKYLRLKAKLLNLPKLTCADIVAPLPQAPHKIISWEEAKNLIFKAYKRFDPIFKQYVKDMYDKNRIDASIRKGKRNGAYCESWYRGKSAIILLSYAGNLREVFTLTHELGHAIHSYLASNEQTYFNFSPGHAISEVASIFGELLITDMLLESTNSKEEKMAILAHVLDDAGQAAFQVSARVWFEQNLYKAIENGENLDGQTISKYWVTARDRIYGDSVEWFNELIWEWTMKPHYYIPNFRFYNYPYVFAQLFVYALYQTYKKKGESFIPKFKKLLSAGGSLSPIEQGKLVGLDITKREFWELGIKQYEEFVNELEKLLK